MPRSSDFFDVGQSATYEWLMAKARATNRERDKIDEANSGSVPLDEPLDQILRVVISAITAGIDTQSWHCVAEGLDMLQQAEVRARKESKP